MVMWPSDGAFLKFRCLCNRMLALEFNLFGTCVFQTREISKLVASPRKPGLLELLVGKKEMLQPFFTNLNIHRSMPSKLKRSQEQNSNNA